MKNIVKTISNFFNRGLEYLGNNYSERYSFFEELSELDEKLDNI